MPQWRKCAKSGGLAIAAVPLYRERRETDDSGMKRIFWIFAVALLSAAALFALLVALLPREALKTHIGEQIATWTGREVSLRGEPEIDIFPALTVTLNDVQVSGPAEMTDAEIVSMDRLTGTIRLLPLLIGQVEIDSFAMVRPLIRLVRDEEGARNWEFDAGAAALQLAFAGDVPLGDFLLEDGTIVYEDRATGESDRLDSVNLSIEWRSVRRPLSIKGDGIWRGEQIALAASAEEPFAFVKGGRTPVEARLESAPITMRFSGEADEYPAALLQGEVSMSTPSLRRFASWLGDPVRPGSTLGPASIFGAATLRGRVLSVEKAEFALDGNEASGALTITAAARPTIAGTLAFSSLDLSSYFAGLATAIRTTPSWREITADTEWFDNLSADVRLSADLVKIGEFQASEVAAGVLLRDARLEVGLAHATLNGGRVSGAVAVSQSAGAAHAAYEAQLRAADLNVARLAPLFGLPDGLSGIASATIDVASSGSDLGALAQGLGGAASLDVRNANLPLVGLGQLAAAGAAPPDIDWRTTIAVTTLSATLSFASGIGILERLDVEAPSLTADIEGWVGLMDGALGLNGVVWATPVGTRNGAGQPFTIAGTLGRPIARPVALAN